VQDKEAQRLIEHIKGLSCLRDVVFVENREYGCSDLSNSAYVRLDSDREARNYYRNEDFWVGLYVLIADVTNIDNAVNVLLQRIESFGGCIARCTEVGTNSEAIYQQETGELLQQNCKYVMIRFDLLTQNNCLVGC
jgi:hypothetical protein